MFLQSKQPPRRGRYIFVSISINLLSVKLFLFLNLAFYLFHINTCEMHSIYLLHNTSIVQLYYYFIQAFLVIKHMEKINHLEILVVHSKAFQGTFIYFLELKFFQNPFKKILQNLKENHPYICYNIFENDCSNIVECIALQNLQTRACLV